MEENLIWRRIAAFLLDRLISMVPFFLVLLSLFFARNDNDFNNIGIGIIISVLFSYLYHIFKDLNGGISLGKKVMKIKVVSKEGVSKPKWYKLVLRNLIMILIPYGTLVEFIAMLVNKDHRRLGDIWFGTKVERI